jgi:hypothetical protein
MLRKLNVLAIVLVGWSIQAPASEPVPPGEAWTKTAIDGLAAREYRFSWQDGALSAPNRAQDFRTRLGSTGFSIVSRTKGESAFRVELALARVGRGGELLPVENGVLVEANGRGELRRPNVTEWLDNTTRGVEHGLVLSRPPAGEAKSPVVASFRLGGDVLAYVEGNDGQSVLFKDPSGVPVVRYAQLLVTDALKHSLPAHMVVAPGELRFVIDDRDAVYPVTVDPLATSPQWQVFVHQSGAQLGGSVAAAGDINGDGYSDVLVAAQLYDEGESDEGKAFLYLGGPSGLSTTPAWSAQTNQDSANICSVAGAGDVNADGRRDVIIGSCYYDGSGFDSGAAFIWLGGIPGPGNPSGLGPDGTPANAYWSAFGTNAGDYFGSKVARAGNVNGDACDDVIIGAPGATIFEPGDGAAYVYHGHFGGPSIGFDWVAYDAGSVAGEAQFGAAVAWAGDVDGDGFDDVVVGAPGWSGVNTQEGAIFLYKGSSGGLDFNPAWSRSSHQDDARMGHAVSGVGDVNGDGLSDIVSGSVWSDDLGFTDNGRIDLWLGHSGAPVGSNWSYRPPLDSAHFGWSIGPAGDVNGDGLADFIVGAPDYRTSPSLGSEGRASVFYGRWNGLPVAGPSWTAEGGQAFANLGNSVSGAGDVNGDGYSDVIVGLSGFDDPNVNSGAARVFHGGAAGLKATADTSLTGQGFADFAYCVAGAGDVNMDGYSDVIIGAPLYDNGQTDEGAAFIYMGSGSGLQTTPANVFEGNQANSQFGSSVASAGDFDGDGVQDVVVGAYAYDNPAANSGAVYVYRGGIDGMSGQRWDVGPVQANALAGWSVAGAGDVNGDGKSDIVFGAPSWDGPTADEGAGFVVYGGSSPAAATQFGAGLGSSFHQMGQNVAGVGDVNGDGFSDVADGMYTWDGFNGGDQGKAYLFMGGSGGLSSSPASWGPEGAAPQGYYAQCVAAAGDVNGDGYGDVLVGGQNRVDLYYGTPNGPLPFSSWTFQTAQGGSNLGNWTSLSTAGDVNNDGFSDVIVGAGRWVESGVTRGKAWLFLGSNSGLAATEAWSVTGGSQSAFLGQSVSFAGDVNGDGYSDVIVGDHYDSSLTTRNGKAYVFYGNGGVGGRGVFGFQKNGANSHVVSPLGLLDTDLALSFRGILPVPMGRDGAKLELEIKPLLTPFDGTGTRFDTQGFSATGYVFRDWNAGTVAPLSRFKWRVRVTNGWTPFYPRSPWWGLPDSSRTMTDFKSPCQGQSWYRDADGDGHGNQFDSIFQCTSAPGYVASADDCDDTNPARYTGNPEICDGLDNNCDALVDNAAVPSGSNQISVAKSGPFTATISWSPLAGASSYDIVRGSLATLRAFAGNYTAAVSGCLANNSGGPTVNDTSVPPPGDANWYLIRGVNCGGGGSYDEGVASQSGLRDSEIAASSSACP